MSLLKRGSVLSPWLFAEGQGSSCWPRARPGPGSSGARLRRAGCPAAPLPLRGAWGFFLACAHPCCWPSWPACLASAELPARGTGRYTLGSLLNVDSQTNKKKQQNGSRICLWGIWPWRYREGKHAIQTLLSKCGQALGLITVVPLGGQRWGHSRPPGRQPHRAVLGCHAALTLHQPKLPGLWAIWQLARR